MVHCGKLQIRQIFYGNFRACKQQIEAAGRTSEQDFASCEIINLQPIPACCRTGNFTESSQEFSRSAETDASARRAGGMLAPEDLAQSARWLMI
jgi:hypothetical protein